MGYLKIKMEQIQNSYMDNGQTFYGLPTEQVYLWSRIKFYKRVLLFPVYFLVWIYYFFRFYWKQNIYLQFFKEVRNSSQP